MNRVLLISALVFIFSACDVLLPPVTSPAAARHEAVVKQIAASALALEKCAENFEKLADAVDKIRDETNDPEYGEDLPAISHSYRKLAKLYREIRACLLPNSATKQVAQCTKEALERSKNE